MYKGKVLVRLNLLEHNTVKFGDGLRLALIAYNELQKNEIAVDRWVLYDMLTNISTYRAKKSFEHFYNYIVEYLINGFYPNISSDDFTHSNMSYYVVGDEYIMGQTKISTDLFLYLYSTFWEQIVNYAIYNFFEGPNNSSTQYFDIPFDEYSVFYDYKKFKSPDDITARFLSDLSDFLSFNHIFLLKDFEVSEIGLNLSLPIKFDFKFIV